MDSATWRVVESRECGDEIAPAVRRLQAAVKLARTCARIRGLCVDVRSADDRLIAEVTPSGTVLISEHGTQYL